MMEAQSLRLLILLSDDFPNSHYLFVNFIFEFTGRHKNMAVLCFEVGLLRAAHLRDQIEEFASVHRQ